MWGRLPTCGRLSIGPPRAPSHPNPCNKIKSLDELIATLGGADTGTQSPGPSGLLLEHLQAARRDLLGSISGEYRFSLKEAKGAIASILDNSARTEMKRRLQTLIDSATDRIWSPDHARSVV
jgi:hypothetical protein